MGCRDMNQDSMEKLIELIYNKEQGVTNFEMASLCLSIIAIVISVLTIISDVKLNRTNLQAVYFEQIFGVYLKEKIPSAMEKLDFNSNGRLNNRYREINRVFMEMVRECGYFKYAKNDFYYELIKKTQELDEKLVELAGKRVKKDEQQNEKILIHKEVQDIVNLINKNYHKF